MEGHGLVTHYLLFVISLADRVVNAGLPFRHAYWATGASEMSSA